MSVANLELNSTAAEEFLSFVETALQSHESDQQTIATLQDKVAQQEKVTLEKVAAAEASAKAAALDFTKLDATLAELVQMNILGAEDREKVAREIRKNPNNLLQLIVKMASAMVTPESEGIEVTPESAVDGDVDGWFKRSPNGQRIPVR